MRKFERIKTDEAAIILFPDGHTRMSCRLVDRSEGGVQLRIGASAQLPKEFILLIGKPERRHVCRIVRRIGSRAGCQFISQLSEEALNSDWVYPVDAEPTKGVIKSRLLKRPLIVS